MFASSSTLTRIIETIQCDTGTWTYYKILNLLEWQSDLQFSVDPSTVVSVRSRIGLDRNNKIDEEYITRENIDEDNDDFTNCVNEPCLLKPDPAYLMGEEGDIESRVSVKLKAAIPSFDNGDLDWPERHAKQVFISQQVSGAEMLLHTMHVVITYVARLCRV